MKLLSKLVYICFQTSTEHIQLVSTKKKKKNRIQFYEKKYENQNTRNHIPTIPYASLPSMSLSFMRWTCCKLTSKYIERSLKENRNKQNVEFLMFFVLSYLSFLPIFGFDFGSYVFSSTYKFHKSFSGLT